MTIANHPEAEFSENFDQINYEMEAHVNDRYTQTEGVEIRFKTWWIAFTHFIVARPFDLLYMDQVTSTHLYPKVGSQPSMAFYGETRNILKAGQDEGIIKMENISLINQFVRTSVTNVVKINIAAGKTLTDSQINWLVDACWDGIKSR